MGLDFRMRSVAFSSPLFCWFSKEIANLGCRHGRALVDISVRTPNSPGFYSVCASFPLILARESLSNGLISCSNATFIMARSILCFQYVGSAVIPWPFWNMFALNGCLEQRQIWEDKGFKGKTWTNFTTKTLVYQNKHYMCISLNGLNGALRWFVLDCGQHHVWGHDCNGMGDKG